MEEMETRHAGSNCPGFLLYHTDLRLLSQFLSNAAFKNVLCAVSDYMQTGAEPVLKAEEDAAFIYLKSKADRQTEAYRKTCERNREIARKRKKPSVREPAIESGSSGDVR